jgi:hypothetical protein
MGFGDSTLFWTLVALSGTAAVTAYVVEGARARNLWIVTTLLAAMALAVWFIPSLSALPTAGITTALWIAYPLITVAAVALMLKGRRPAIAASEAQQPTSKKNVLDEISEAIGASDWEDYTPAQSTVNEVMAILNATFASIRKEYGFATPQVTERSKRAMLLGRHYLLEIRPYLQAGHVEEAAAAARKFLGQ